MIHIHIHIHIHTHIHIRIKYDIYGLIYIFLLCEKRIITHKFKTVELLKE